MAAWPSRNISWNIWKNISRNKDARLTNHKMKILITAGPTHEPIDPIRFIGNHSSGKMGIAIAEEFANAENEVLLIKGATHLNPTNTSIKQVKVQTAAEMFDACAQYFGWADVIVFAAAVADYTPKFPSATKIKKKEDEFSIELVKTKDIAAELGKQKTDKQIIVGFALETNNEEAHAKEKLARKNFDFIVLNSMRDEGAGFQGDTNKITIIDREGNTTKFDLKKKTEVAKDIVGYIQKIIGKR
jgi:phosphopantothenoylcysteine decarboxylase/phosphopantothenate--cysteine ligase